MIYLKRKCAPGTAHRAFGVFGEAPGEAVVRRRIVALCMIVYWLLIFEGALRKWALPQISSILFFIRDPFLLAAYWYALRSSRLEGRGWLTAIAVLSVLVAYVACTQALVNGVPLLTLAYGWRNYFLYAPIAFVILTHFEAADVDRVIRHSLIVSIPLAVLVGVQFFSPPEAYINKGLADEGEVFTVAVGVVRTYGTFSFTLGQAMYAISIMGFLLAAVLAARRGRLLSPALLLPCAAAVLVTLLLSGSRTAFIMSAITILMVMLGGMLSSDSAVRARATLLPAALAIGTAVLFPLVFPSSFEAMIHRQTVAVEVEGATHERALGTLTDIVDTLPESPALGFGLGFGSVGGAALATGVLGFTLAESEWSRIVQEIGPIAGLAYLLLRIALTFKVLLAAFSAVRRDNDLTALCLTTLPLMLLFNGPITFQGTVNGYAWITAGLVLAAARTASVRVSRTAVASME